MRNLKGNNRNNLGIGLLTILMLALFATTVVHAKEYKLGVKVGDWVKYGQIIVTWTGSGTEPSYVTEARKVDYERLDVQDASGTTVSLNLTVHYNNGTQTFLRMDTDVNTSSMPWSYLIASNLTAGDPLMLRNPLIPSAPASIINQTMTSMYAGANRNVNVIDIKGNWTAEQVTWQYESKRFWDQNSGIMVENYMNQTYNTSESVQTSFKATETNLWSPNPLDLIQNNLVYILAGVALIIIIIAATIVLRKRKPTSTQQPPPPSTPPPPAS
jgi:hypothetical protein